MQGPPPASFGRGPAGLAGGLPAWGSAAGRYEDHERRLSVEFQQHAHESDSGRGRAMRPYLLLPCSRSAGGAISVTRSRTSALLESGASFISCAASGSNATVVE